MSMPSMPLKTSDFDYPLDSALIAQGPLDRRDESRLMVLNHREGRATHRVFSDLPNLLRPGDLLVLNDTRVIPARFSCRRKSSGRIEGLFVRELAPGCWEAMLKNAARCAIGERLRLDGAADVHLELTEKLAGGLWRVRVDPPTPAVEILERAGATPLPPYIRRSPGHDDRADRRRYQSVYAERPGAIAAPTAGLHFTHRLMESLIRRGVEFARLTLHVGLGTFRPVESEDPRDHRMHAEWYELPGDGAARLNAARAERRRIIAVGTTCVRVLETATGGTAPAPGYERRQADPGGPFRACSGWTDIFIRPPAEFRAVDALITNFHLPRSTLLMLVAAFCRPGRTDGLETILTAYAEAQKLRYRFYSYGDAMLIE